MDTSFLYGVTTILLICSFFKNRKKTLLALKKGLKSFKKILPQFLSVITIVGLMLAVLMKKGARFSNMIILLGAWSTTKIPMFLFETAMLGAKFAFIRLAINIPGIIIISYILNLLLNEKDIHEITESVCKL